MSLSVSVNLCKDPIFARPRGASAAAVARANMIRPMIRRLSTAALWEAPPNLVPSFYTPMKDRCVIVGKPYWSYPLRRHAASGKGRTPHPRRSASSTARAGHSASSRTRKAAAAASLMPPSSRTRTQCAPSCLGTARMLSRRAANTLGASNPRRRIRRIVRRRRRSSSARPRPY